MDLLFSASFIASFFAGVAALFAPCCITVLLPTYFASIFKQKSTIYLMTFVYFLGLLVIFLPIGFGAAFLTRFISQNHNTIYFMGAVFLIFLGLMLVTGRHLSFPSPVHPTLKTYGLGSVFVLGIFSGIATTCCAPVLAGVVALSALPGSVFLGGIYTLAYVLGMVAPLFIIATFLDRVDFTKKLMALRRPFYGVTISNLISGLMFLGLGILILFLAQTNQLSTHASYQLTLNLFLAQLTKIIAQYTSLLPEYVWAGVFVFLALFIIRKAILQIKHES
ncbi:MAG: cytochrome c biogenesis protein CcdA [Patescibacteria group bacterium]